MPNPKNKNRKDPERGEPLRAVVEKLWKDFVDLVDSLVVPQPQPVPIPIDRGPRRR